MVRLDSIEYINFFNIPHQLVPLADQGLVAVQGDNGDGKTAMFMEGPFFALYGKSLRTDKAIGNKFRTHGKKGWAVNLELTKGDDSYTIRRSHGVKGLEAGLHLFQNGTPLTRGTMADTQELITDNLIGLSHLGAKNAVFYDAEVLDFPTLGDVKKKEILDDLLQLGALERALDITRKEIKKLTKEIDKLDSAMVAFEQVMATSEANLAKSTAARDQWGGLRDARIKVAEERVLKIEGELNFDDQITDLKKGIESARYEIEKREPKLAKKTAIWEEKKKALQEVKDLWLQEKTVADTRLRGAEQSIAEHERALSADGGVCTSCGQEIPSDTEAVERHKRLIGEQKAKLEEQLEERRKMEPPKEIAELEEWVGVAFSAKGELEKAISSWRDDGLKCQTNLHEVEKAKASALMEVELARREVRAIKEETNPHGAVVDQITGDIADTKAKIKETGVKKALLDASLTDERTLEVLFGAKGCRLDLLNQAIPYLNKQAEEIRRLLNTRISVQFRLKAEGESHAGTLITDVSNPGGAQSYEWDSRGERRRADIILLMSLLMLASSRGAHSIQQAFFDEAFESLDPDGQASMVNLFKFMAIGRSSIFVITHIANDLAGKVDKLWTVSKGKLTT